MAGAYVMGGSQDGRAGRKKNSPRGPGPGEKNVVCYLRGVALRVISLRSAFKRTSGAVVELLANLHNACGRLLFAYGPSRGNPSRRQNNRAAASATLVGALGACTISIRIL